MELAARIDNGVEVTLESVRPGRVALYVLDRLTNRGFRVELPARDGADAFRNPFRYGARAGFDPFTYRASRGPLL